LPPPGGAIYCGSIFHNSLQARLSAGTSEDLLMAHPPAVSGSRTVLVVDDEPLVRTILCQLLEEWGFKAAEADNGQSALQLARKLKGGLTMVITDLVMPHMDGYAFAKAFRQLYPDVPILFTTGQFPGALEDMMSKEREQILFKPFNPDAFLEAVARLLESRVNQKRVS
jgi:CheY-like chemotaxis protein